MKTNVGSIDQAIRLIVGIVLIAVPWLSGYAIFDSTVAKYGATLVGLVLVGTAMMKSCPVYSMLGIRTCKP